MCRKVLFTPLAEALSLRRGVRGMGAGLAVSKGWKGVPDFWAEASLL